MNKIKVYIASPFFNDTERQFLKALRDDLAKHEDIIPIFPMDFEVDCGIDMPNAEWGLKVFQHDVEDIQQADEVWVVSYGLYSDSGTAWECGYARGIGKTVRLIVVENDLQSLMMVNGCDEVSYFHLKRDCDGNIFLSIDERDPMDIIEQK